MNLMTPAGKPGIRLWSTIFILVLFLTGTPLFEAFANTKRPNTSFSKSPEEIANALEGEERFAIKKSLIPYAPLQTAHNAWHAGNDVLKEKANFNLGLAYTTLYQNMSESLPGTDDDAFGGDIDVNGKWGWLNVGEIWEASVSFWAEGRHHIITDLAPGDLYPNVGSVMGPTDTFESDHFIFFAIWVAASLLPRLRGTLAFVRSAAAHSGIAAGIDAR